MTQNREPMGNCTGNCAYCETRGTPRRDGTMPMCVRVESETVLRMSGTAGLETIGPERGLDPYDQGEGRCPETRQRLEKLLQDGRPARVITRSARIVEDLPLLSEIARRASATVLIGVATVDAELARVWEPQLLAPDRRLALMRRIREAGVSAGLMAAPLVPFLMDDHPQLRSLLWAAQQSGAQYYCVDPTAWGEELALDRLMPIFAERWPQLLEPLQRLYGGEKSPPRAYTDKIAGQIERLAPGARLSDRNPAAWSPGALLANAFASHYQR
ncbi:MAG TPA: radical SAM protein [Chloroflexota bacterium]|nr:radical SAM protein [Chloroflexota bacterium]